MKPRKYLLALLFTALFFTARLGVATYQEHTWGSSVVKLLSTYGGGTGFQVRYRGNQYTMTNDHVCNIAQNGFLIAESPLVATKWVQVLAQSGDTDLCLLTPVPGLPALELGKEEFKKFESVTIIGHPKMRPLEISHGMNLITHYIDVLLGVIQSKEDEDRCKMPKNRIIEIFWGMFRICTAHVRSQHTTAHIEPGSSGSPVLDSNGKVRGVAFAAAGDNKADIIPLKDILKFLNAVVHHASRKRT